MNIESKNYPIITLSFTNSPSVALDVLVFSKRLVTTEPNPYSRMAEEETFENTYIMDNKLVFPAAIIAMVCSGDFTYHDAIFSEKEIMGFINYIKV